MNPLRSIFPIAFLSLLIAGGCSNSDCYENHSALPLADFYSTETYRQVNINRLYIYGIGAPGDSILYSGQTLSEAYLPFRLGMDSTSYVFAYLSLLPSSDPEESTPEGDADNSDTNDNTDEERDDSTELWDRIKAAPHDTITFRYRPLPWFVSPACGAMYFFDVDTVKYTTHLIDSIHTLQRITNVNASNIQIFFKSDINQ